MSQTKTDTPSIAELLTRPAVRITLLGGHFTDDAGVRHRRGDVVTMPGERAVGFLMNGVADLAPDDAPAMEGIAE